MAERFCNKCGYFGPDKLHQRPNGTGQCGYLSMPSKVAPPPAGAQQAVAWRYRANGAPWEYQDKPFFNGGSPGPREEHEPLTLSELLEILATPAAAQGAVNAIAALVPQIEDSIHGKRYRCQQCGYAWGAGLDGSEAHATNCAYVIATSVPHTPPAAVAATPAPEVAPSAKEDGHA